MSSADGPQDEARLSIGALSRAVGVPVETLRTWEQRYGFPVPERKPSGHRLYRVSYVPRLKRIAAVLSRGHRAAEVVAASDEILSQLLAATPNAIAGAAETAPADVSDLIGIARSYDSERLVRILLGDWSRMRPLEFLEQRIAPLVRRVGDDWEAGRIEIRHEHFIAERLGDLLRSLRLRLEEGATGPLVVLATLPGELHGLGLQMAAMVFATAGCRVLYLGTDVPLEEMRSLVRDLRATALALSISTSAAAPETAARLHELRALVPRRVRLVVGGGGAPQGIEGVEVMHALRDIERWARELVEAGPLQRRSS
ncbi:MAG TPA: MerR family transcriptional regulator [Polyangia bacterium]|jgi:methanogenic corrinoid protein MtbC1|nr:MerR family transcriptional regulator [Polyangia bacterium]